MGLGYGDEGKGMAVAFETARALAFGLEPVNVRFNGGPQAAHNVRIKRDDGTVMHHTHSQFGSGTMLGAKTILTDGMLFDPLALRPELTHLQTILGRDVLLAVDPRCPVVLPIHVEANRAIERARTNRHGSTGRGIGIARMCEHAVRSGDVSADYMIDVGTLFDYRALREKMDYWRSWIHAHQYVKVSQPNLVDVIDISSSMDTFSESGMLMMTDTHQLVRDLMTDGRHSVIFEGSQGIMLDARYGDFPHVTYGDMTAQGVYKVVGDELWDRVDIMGVTRSYVTRHGMGSMPNEGTADVPEKDNETYEWAGAFRTGILDLRELWNGVYFSRAKEVAVSCLDRYPGRYTCLTKVGECSSEVLPHEDEDIVGAIERECYVPVTVTGRGETLDMWKDI